MKNIALFLSIIFLSIGSTVYSQSKSIQEEKLVATYIVNGANVACVGPPSTNKPAIVINTPPVQANTITPERGFDEITTFRWTWSYNPNNGATTWINNTIATSVTVACSGVNGNGYTLHARGINPCGEAVGPTYVYVFMVSNYYPSMPVPDIDINQAYIVYPNPTSDILTIDIDTELHRELSETKTRANYIDILTKQSENANVYEIQQMAANIIVDQACTYDIYLYDNYGNLLRQARSDGESTYFDLNSLPAGPYYLHIYDGADERPAIRTILKK